MNANTMAKRAQKLYAAIPAWPKQTPKFFHAWLLQRIIEEYERQEVLSGAPAKIVRTLACLAANERETEENLSCLKK